VHGFEVEKPLELEYVDVIEIVQGAEVVVGFEAGHEAEAVLGVAAEAVLGFGLGAEAVLGFGAEADQSHAVDELASSAEGIVELQAVDRDSTADNAVDRSHIQDTAGSIADTVVVADTTVLELAQQTELQLVLENLGLLAD
jgi:hypothetical protein